ncbi:hypothetical protein KM043_008754 [Ampulex compressa]|nr:hypothetical protein KM043_008754 [Ampulex compressa]
MRVTGNFGPSLLEQPRSPAAIGGPFRKIWHAESGFESALARISRVRRPSSHYLPEKQWWRLTWKTPDDRRTDRIWARLAGGRENKDAGCLAEESAVEAILGGVRRTLERIGTRESEDRAGLSGWKAPARGPLLAG